MLRFAMLFCLISPTLIDASEQSGEVHVVCHSFMRSSGVAGSALLIGAVLV